MQNAQFFQIQGKLNFQDPILGLLIAPLRAFDSSLDFDEVERIIGTPNNEQDQIRPFQFHPEHYVDAVVTHWYEGKGSTGSNTIDYVDSISPMTLDSRYPDKKYRTYAEYVS